MKTSKYIVNGILVEGTRSEGGLFYDIKVVETGARMRVLAEIFEKYAKEYHGPEKGNE